MRQGNRVIGAGKFYWKPLGGTDWVEIGETQGGSINTTVEKKEAHDKSSVLNKVVAVVATAVSATIKFDTNIHSKENLELYMLGTSEDITYEIGDELPDGSTATAQIVIPKISAGTDPIKKGSIRFVGDADGDEQPITICNDVVVMPTGDRELIGNDFTALSFEGVVLKDSNGLLYEEHTIPLA